MDIRTILNGNGFALALYKGRVKSKKLQILEVVFQGCQLEQVGTLGTIPVLEDTKVLFFPNA